MNRANNYSEWQTSGKCSHPAANGEMIPASLLSIHTIWITQSINPYTNSLANSCNQHATNIIGQGRKKIHTEVWTLDRSGIQSCNIQPPYPLHYSHDVRIPIRDYHIRPDSVRTSIATFWPKMFGLNQAEAQNFLKICSDQHQALSPIIGGPVVGWTSCHIAMEALASQKLITLVEVHHTYTTGEIYVNGS